MYIKRSLLGLLSIFIVFSGWLYFLSTLFITEENQLHFPHDLEDLKEITGILQHLKQENFALVMMLFCSAYIYKQTFAIPGSVFMNILAGALFGIWVAFPLVCCLTTIGASCCFLLSRMFGRQILMQKFPDRLLQLQAKVKDNEDRLLFFLLSARFFPMSPNWFLNMASPIIGVPILLFSLSVFVGLMPYNFVCVQTGSVLSSMASLDDVFSTSTMLGLFFVAIAVFLPGVVLRKISSKHFVEQSMWI